MSGQKPLNPALNFVIGGSSGMFATCCIQPIDFIKVQCQVQGEGKKGGSVSPFTIARETYQKLGMRRFYTGLDSALLRQATYTTARLGIYKTLSDVLVGNSTAPLPFWKKCLLSITAGGIGSLVGNPADLALIRMQADHTLPAEQRRHYTGVGNALSRIVKEEGTLALWRGSTPTAIRAMALNLGMLAPFDQAKEMLRAQFGNFQGLVVCASMIAAFFASVLSLPFDNVKTKYQRMAKGADGKFPYTSFADCFMKTLSKEGPLGFYVGFPTFVTRIAPHVVITLVVQELLTQFAKSRQ